WFGPVCHRRPTLGAELLDDHLLDVTITLTQVANCYQCINAPFPSLANSNKDSRGERNLLAPCILKHTQPLRRIFIGSVVMSGTRREQPFTGRFKHKP